MGSQPRALQLFIPLLTTSPSCRTKCFYAMYGGRNGGSHWDTSTRSNERRKFESYGDDGFVFSGAKKRVWWSDDDDEWPWEDDDDDGFGSFGALEESISFSWIFKLVRAFGWMVPAIIISMLLGTGPNTIVMALVLPIAQSVVSFIADTFWERPNSASTKPKSRTKKRPFTGPTGNSGMGGTEEFYAQTGNSAGSYQSWAASNHVKGKKEQRGTQSFGGWDELDKQGETDGVPKRTPSQNANEPRKHNRGKLSRKVRKRDSPLLIRLLVAVFPFLGFWTKLM